jgi:hypothetical protein
MIEPNKTRWAVHEKDDVLRIWYNGKLVGEIQGEEFAYLILELAKHLKERLARKINL